MNFIIYLYVYYHRERTACRQEKKGRSPTFGFQYLNILMILELEVWEHSGTGHVTYFILKHYIIKNKLFLLKTSELPCIDNMTGKFLREIWTNSSLLLPWSCTGFHACRTKSLIWLIFFFLWTCIVLQCKCGYYGINYFN